MSDVEQENQRKQLQAAKKEAQLAHAAHEFFTNTEGGIELYKELEFKSGANHPAFSAKDNFNTHGAAFRDGMRATFLQIQRLIQSHAN